MPNNNFLFINKDSSSKSLSNNYDEGALGPNRIHKHVQRLSARQRREQAAIIDTNARAVLGWYSTRQSRWLPGPTLPQEQRCDADCQTVEHNYSGPVDDSKKVRVYKGKPRCRHHKAPSPSKHDIDPALDSLPNTIVKLTAKEHRILQYYLKDWMPSDKHIPPDCQVAGFTPIWPDDPVNTGVVIKGAFQTRSPVSIYSLLAAAARRMQKVDKATLPELYSYRAISSLRARLDNPEDIDERLILDLSYLIHFDFHTDFRTRNDIYWKLSRDTIVRLGGLHKISPFTARIAAAYDYVAALYSVTLPKLDPFRDVALLGFDEATSKPEEVEKALSQLEPRLRHEIRLHHYLADLFDAVKALPDPTSALFKDYLITRNGHTIYAVMAGPFQRFKPEKVTKSSTDSLLTLADEMHAMTRGLMSHVWMWYGALSFLGYQRRLITEDDPWAEARLYYRAPDHVADPQIFKRWQSLDRVQTLLDGSEWKIPDDRLLWFLSIGYIIARNAEEREPYRERFIQLAEKMNIRNEDDLKRALELHMPLDQIAPTWASMLASLLTKNEDVVEQDSTSWTMLKHDSAENVQSVIPDRHVVLPTLTYGKPPRLPAQLTESGKATWR